MQKKSKKSSNESNSEDSEVTLEGLIRLPQSAYPTMPSWQDQVTQHALTSTEETNSAATRKRGLYQEILQSRPEALYQDSLDNPKKYAPEVVESIRELFSTRREPTDEERQLLDAAVLDFLQSPRVDKAPAPVPVKKPKKSAFPSFRERELSVPSMESLAEPSPKAFWWL